MPNAATLMPPKAKDLLQKQERSASVVGFEEAVVDFFVDAADLLGVPKSVAVLYGIVFASPQPLSFADIEARGTLSKGSISLRSAGAAGDGGHQRGFGAGGPVGAVYPRFGEAPAHPALFGATSPEATRCGEVPARRSPARSARFGKIPCGDPSFPHQAAAILA